jgi:hypothetical protein
MSNKTYSEKLKDPRWQKKRLEILQRDEWICQNCGDDESTLHVHHKWYEPGNEPWDYPPEALITLCEDCHQREEVSKVKQMDLIKTFLAAGFLNTEMDFLSHLLSFCFELIGKVSFETYIARLAISDSFRKDVEDAYKKERESQKKQQEAQYGKELPF